MGGMKESDWLAQLAPAHAPPPPGWWPPAPGWWAVAALVLLAAACLFYWRGRRVSRLRRLALRELRKLESIPSDDTRLAAEVEHLMRRYAVAAYGREAAGHLTGESWLAFIVAHGGRLLDGESGQRLLHAAYGGTAQGHRSRWLEGAQRFIRGRA